MAGPREGRGTSLWLVPEGDAGARLAELVRELARRLGTTPFVPHVTLLAGLTVPTNDVLKRATQMVSSLEPLRVPLRRPESADQFFRCLYLPVGETFKLLATHAQARMTFGIEDDAPFEPHLSLVYGELQPATREALFRELAPVVPTSFELQILEVVRTEGPVAAWRCLRRLELGAPSA
jgi:2'-5' RNA ligase